MLASLLSKPQPSLSAQTKRLVAMRFLIYTGFQTSYFIGVIGTLTYSDDASVVATSLAVLFMNVFVILGSFAGGAALDAWGPRRHFLLSIVGTLATGAAILVFGSATGIVLLGAVLLGFVMGFAQPIATSYPSLPHWRPRRAQRHQLRHRHVLKREYYRRTHVGWLCRGGCVVARGVRAHDALYRAGVRRRLGL